LFFWLAIEVSRFLARFQFFKFWRRNLSSICFCSLRHHSVWPVCCHFLRRPKCIIWRGEGEVDCLTYILVHDGLIISIFRVFVWPQNNNCQFTLKKNYVTGQPNAEIHW
jgi:hypothetical protein